MSESEDGFLVELDPAFADAMPNPYHKTGAHRMAPSKVDRIWPVIAIVVIIGTTIGLGFLVVS